MCSVTKQLSPACSPDLGSQHPSCGHGVTLIQIITTEAALTQPPLGGSEPKVLSPDSREGCHSYSAKGGSWENNLDVFPSRVSAIAQQENGEVSPMTQGSVNHILKPGDGVTGPITKTRNRFTLESSCRRHCDITSSATAL